MHMDINKSMVYQFCMYDNPSNQITARKLPVYLQITEQITREIGAGLLVDGQRLPAERQLAQNYGVTVRTLRKSLSRLTDLGLLSRKQGSGNYICKNENSHSIYSFFRLELLQGGGLPSAKILQIDTLTKPKTLPHFGSSHEGHRFRRLRFLNEYPVAVEEIWLDRSCISKINKSRISDSLYKFYKDDLELLIMRTEDWVGIDSFPEWGEDIFFLAPQENCGFVERFGWSQTDQKVEYSRTWFDAGRARYVARLR